MSQDTPSAALEAQARAWAQTRDPAALPAQCPAALVEYLVTGWGAGRWFGAIVANPAVPDTARAALAAAVSGYRKKELIADLIEHEAAPSAWVAMARALTPSRLAHGLGVLQDSGASWRPFADATRRAAIIESFATSSDARARALVAEACALSTDPEHDPTGGTLSAPKLAADPAVGVRVGLARNYAMRSLAEDEAGLAVRQRLLADPSDRVRTAARRHGIAVLTSDLHAAMNASWARHGDTLGPLRPGEPAGAPTPPVPAPPVPAPPVPAPPVPNRPDKAAWEPRLRVGDPLDDPSPRVRATAAGTILLGDDARWARLLSDPSPQVRAAAIRWGLLTPQRREQLAGDAQWQVRRRVAASGRAPAAVLQRLVHDPDRRVAEAAAAVVLEKMADTAAGTEPILRRRGPS